MKKTDFNEQLYCTPQLRIVEWKCSGVFAVSNPSSTEDLENGGEVDWFN